MWFQGGAQVTRPLTGQSWQRRQRCSQVTVIAAPRPGLRNSGSTPTSTVSTRPSSSSPLLRPRVASTPLALATATSMPVRDSGRRHLMLSPELTRPRSLATLTGPGPELPVHKKRFILRVCRYICWLCCICRHICWLLLRNNGISQCQTTHQCHQAKIILHYLSCWNHALNQFIAPSLSIHFIAKFFGI